VTSFEINLAPRASDVDPPMMLVDGIFLVYIDLEELVVVVAFEVLISAGRGY
jgi:hypothetical protein